jgi:hypothetical protein
MIGIDWVYKNKDDVITNGKWVVTEEGKRWIQKYYYHITRKG